MALPGRIHVVSVCLVGGASVVTRSEWSTSSGAFEPRTSTRHGVANGPVTVNVGCTGCELPRPAYCIRYVRSVPTSSGSAASIIRGYPNRADSQMHASAPSGSAAVSGWSLSGPVSVRPVLPLGGI